MRGRAGSAHIGVNDVVNDAFISTVVGHYLLFEARDDRRLLDSAVIETNELPLPPQQNWDPASPYHNLCQVLHTTLVRK